MIKKIIIGLLLILFLIGSSEAIEFQLSLTDSGKTYTNNGVVITPHLIIANIPSQCSLCDGITSGGVEIKWIYTDMEKGLIAYASKEALKVEIPLEVIAQQDETIASFLKDLLDVLEKRV